MIIMLFYMQDIRKGSIFVYFNHVLCKDINIYNRIKIVKIGTYKK